MQAPYIQTLIEKYFPPRLQTGHKKSYGHCFVVGASRGMTGAATLCALGALRSGCGYVTAGIPESLNNIMEIKLTEALTLPLAETTEASLSLEACERIQHVSTQVSSMVVGPGLSTHPITQELVRALIKTLSCPCVLDADALTALACEPSILNTSPSPQLILTPHMGEFCRLIGENPGSILTSAKNKCVDFAKKHNVILVLKGHRSLVTNGQALYENTTGNPGLSTAGTGDILAGMIAAFIAQHIPFYEATILAVYFHGLAGDVCARSMGMMGMLASDVISHLPQVLKPYERIEASDAKQ